VSDLHEVLDVVFDRLENENIDVLLVTGDITNHGSKKSHQAFANKLYTLKHNGIQTYVIPGNHDVNIPNSKSYIGDKAKVIESVSTEEFAKIYGSFGYGNALSRDAHSLSYLSELNDSTWLMSIDTNKFAEYTNSSISSGRILSSTMSWAIDILREAKRKNIIVLGMMHHLDNWQDNAEILADEGLKIIFTGHFHSTDAAEFITYKGNKIVDVETGSLAQYPFPFRIIKLKNYELNIDTHFVESIPDNPDLWN
jgi:3',5'-cyclic AMP phosphodiesterase CpdA